MDENEKDVQCGACGISFDKVNAKEVEVSRTKNSEDEEIITTMFLCPYCARHQFD